MQMMTFWRKVECIAGRLRAGAVPSPSASEANYQKPHCLVATIQRPEREIRQGVGQDAGGQALRAVGDEVVERAGDEGGRPIRPSNGKSRRRG